MTRTSIADMNCSFARAADVIGDKWALLILRDAFYGVQSFVQFRRRLGVAPTVLTDRLESLCAAGILERVRRREDVDRHVYRLTEAGRALFPVVVGLMQWGDAFVSGEGNEPVKLFDQQMRRPIRPIQVTNENGQRLDADSVVYMAGPGANAQTRAALEKGNSG